MFIDSQPCLGTALKLDTLFFPLDLTDQGRMGAISQHCVGGFRQGRKATKVKVLGFDVPTLENPGLAARRWYAGEYMKHVTQRDTSIEGMFGKTYFCTPKGLKTKFKPTKIRNNILTIK